jgi:hypothetical protein
MVKVKMPPRELETRIMPSPDGIQGLDPTRLGCFDGEKVSADTADRCRAYLAWCKAEQESASVSSLNIWIVQSLPETTAKPGVSGEALRYVWIPMGVPIAYRRRCTDCRPRACRGDASL